MYEIRSRCRKRLPSCKTYRLAPNLYDLADRAHEVRHEPNAERVKLCRELCSEARERGCTDVDKWIICINANIFTALKTGSYDRFRALPGGQNADRRKVIQIDYTAGKSITCTPDGSHEGSSGTGGGRRCFDVATMAPRG